MNTVKNSASFSIKIKRIKEFYFILNEAISERDKPVTVQFQHITRFFGDTNLIDLTLRVYYTHDPDIPAKTILVDIHVQNVFEIDNLNQFLVNTEFVLPQNLMIMMVGLSISHTRALVAKNISGTIYQDNIIPVADPAEVAKVFYPNIFLEQENHGIIKDSIMNTRKKKAR